MLTRRRFLAAAAAAPMLARSASAAPPAPVPLAVTEVAPGVHIHQGRHALFSPENAGDISNCGFVIGRDAVAVVDTGGSARVGAALHAAVRVRTQLPIRYVVNTHMHPDHVFGNAPFQSEGTAFVGHFKMARGLAGRAERYTKVNSDLLGDAAFEGTRIVLPTLEIRERHALDLGGRRILLTPRATAHTDNDLTVLDEARGTLFLGDLLFSGHVPTIDGSLRGWIKLLGDLRAETPARVVPGHGPPAMDWPAASDPLARYLAAVAGGVRAAIRSGKTLAEAAETVGLEERDAWELFADYHKRNVSAAFAELEWE